MGDLDAAEEYFRKALAANGDFLRAREKIAVIMVKRGNYEAAERMIGGNREVFADIYKILGDIKFYQGELDEAEAQYRRSLDVNAEYTGAILSLALTLRKKGHEDEADAILRKLLEIDPENVIARNLLGRGPLDLDAP
jgi:tetratricopeptide (TPR) repeat protein